MRCVLIKKHGEYPDDSKEPDDSFELEQIKNYGKSMSYEEAIKVIKTMEVELNIDPKSTQGQALFVAVDALRIMNYATKAMRGDKCVDF